MLLPKTGRVGGHTYRIEHARDSFAIGKGDEGVGYIDYYHNKMKICIRPQTNSLETLLHECIHAIGEDRKLDLTEHQVDQVAAGLMSLQIDGTPLPDLRLSRYYKGADYDPDGQVPK